MAFYSQDDTDKEVYAGHGHNDFLNHNTSTLLPPSPGHDAPEVQPPAEPEVLKKEELGDAYDLSQKETLSSPGAVTNDTGLIPVPPLKSKIGNDLKKRGPKFWLIIAAVTIAVVVGIVVGAVVGTRSSRNSSNGDQAEESAPSDTPTPSPSSTATPKADQVTVGDSFNASFTYYGTGDDTAGLNCTSLKNACGFYTKPGYAASVSQALFGARTGAGPGPACGACYQLHATIDASGNSMNKSAVVMVNDLCPAPDNPICGQKDLDDTNQWDAQVNFNLCIDSGAAGAILDRDAGVGLATGTAIKVDCEDWKGDKIDD